MEPVAQDKRSSPAPQGAQSGKSVAAPASSVQLKHALRGESFATQESILAPRAPLQMKKNGAAPAQVHQAAAAGIAGGGGALPHGDRIQAAFGHHDVSAIQAHSGPEAVAANRAMGANAYATGDHVAFGGTPDLHTAAHEAAHVVQQQHGVSLSGGVGQSGDAYERQADAVADKVVRGESAEPLLDGTSGGSGPVQRAVQRDEPPITKVSFTKTFEPGSGGGTRMAVQRYVPENEDGSGRRDDGAPPAAEPEATTGQGGSAAGQAAEEPGKGSLEVELVAPDGSGIKIKPGGGEVTKKIPLLPKGFKLPTIEFPLPYVNSGFVAPTLSAELVLSGGAGKDGASQKAELKFGGGFHVGVGKKDLGSVGFEGGIQTSISLTPKVTPEGHFTFDALTVPLEAVGKIVLELVGFKMKVKAGSYSFGTFRFAGYSSADGLRGPGEVAGGAGGKNLMNDILAMASTLETVGDVVDTAQAVFTLGGSWVTKQVIKGVGAAAEGLGKLVGIVETDETKRARANAARLMAEHDTKNEEAHQEEAYEQEMKSNREHTLAVMSGPRSAEAVRETESPARVAAREMGSIVTGYLAKSSNAAGGANGSRGNWRPAAEKAYMKGYAKNALAVEAGALYATMLARMEVEDAPAVLAQANKSVDLAKEAIASFKQGNEMQGVAVAASEEKGAPEDAAVAAE